MIVILKVALSKINNPPRTIVKNRNTIANQFILKINDCTVESVYRGENVTLATFAFKSSEVKKTEDTDWGLPNKRVRC